jgi:hypothetical protein
MGSTNSVPINNPNDVRSRTPNFYRQDFTIGKVHITATHDPYFPYQTPTIDEPVLVPKTSFAIGSDRHRIKWSEAHRAEQTLGMEHKVQLLKSIPAENTFVEYGAMNVNTPKGSESRAFIRLGFSF